METLKVVTSIQKQGKNGPYLSLTFNDGRTVNYFYKGVAPVGLDGKEVDVELEKKGEYWNVKSVEMHAPCGITPMPSPPPPMVGKSSEKIWALNAASRMTNDPEQAVIIANRFLEFLK